MSERSRNKMAIMSRKVDFGFKVAPEKEKQFIRGVTTSKSFASAMNRAERNIHELNTRTVKRK